jgi:hypothetical protein
LLINGLGLNFKKVQWFENGSWQELKQRLIFIDGINGGGMVEAQFELGSRQQRAPTPSAEDSRWCHRGTFLQEPFTTERGIIG